MELKYNLKVDAMANLYRSALYMAKGDRETSKMFFDKAKKYLDEKIFVDSQDYFSNSNSNNRFFAEMILDKYQIVKNQLFTKQ